MLLAYYVYFWILVIVVAFGWVTSHNRQRGQVELKRADILIPVLLVSLLMGFRYQVGTDWKQYQSIYINVLHFGMSWQEIADSTMEPLYWILNVCIASFDLPYQLFFAVIMFLHLILLYKSFDRYVFLLPWGLFFYFTTVFTTSLNIHRQTLSFCIFLYALKFVIDRNFLKYFLWIGVAALIHYSSLILFPVYFLSVRGMRFLDNKYVMLLLYGLSFFLFEYFLNFITDILSLYIVNAKYLQNLSVLGNREMEVSSGLGILSTYVVDIVLILYSKRLSKVFGRYRFNVLFRIFFVGICLANAFGIDVFLSRVPFALESLRFLMLAYLVYYLFGIKRSVFGYSLGGVIVLLYLMMFLAGIYNGHSGCSPFQFA